MTLQDIYLLIIAAFLITLFVFPFAVRIAKRYNIVDNPDARKLQTEPVPVFGGVAVAVGLFIPLIYAASVFHVPALWYEIAVMLCMLVIGVTDDIRGLPAWLRFVVEIFIVWFLLWRTHIVIDNFHGLWHLQQLTVYSSLPLSIIAGVGIINSINLIDGVDGYSSGYGIVTNTLFAVVFFVLGEEVCALFSAVTASALLPFFLHNVFGKSSKMYIGDGGSLLIGMVMVCNIFFLLSDSSTAGELMRQSGIGAVAFALAALCIPVFDTLHVMFARIADGVSPFTPDKTHLHHLFIDMGFSHVGTSITIILINMLIVLLWWLSCLLGLGIDGQFYLVIALGLFFTCGLYYGMRYCQRRNNCIWQTVQRIGKWTHFEQKGAWAVMQKIVDFGC
jgi:UDP-N-acetylmuramyl pentapeptide phosphotransferase/UDP-N-acetylglucosamine-1-phosphate transferase